MVDYNTKSIIELKEICKKKGLKGYSKLTKNQLMAFLESDGRLVPTRKVSTSKHPIHIKLAMDIAKSDFRVLGVTKGESECAICGKAPIYNIARIRSNGVIYDIGTTCMWKPYAVKYLGIKYENVDTADKYLKSSAKSIWKMERDVHMREIVKPYSPTKKYPSIKDIPNYVRLSEVLDKMWHDTLNEYSKIKAEEFLKQSNMEKRNLTQKQYKYLLKYYKSLSMNNKTTEKQKKDFEYVKDIVNKKKMVVNLTKEQVNRKFSDWLTKHKVNKKAYNMMDGNSKSEIRRAFIKELKGEGSGANEIFNIMQYEKFLEKHNLLDKNVDDWSKGFLYNISKRNGLTFKQQAKLDEIKSMKRRVTTTKAEIEKDTKDKYVGKTLLSWKIRDLKKKGDLPSTDKGEYILVEIEKETERAVLGTIEGTNGNRVHKVWIPKAKGFK